MESEPQLRARQKEIQMSMKMLNVEHEEIVQKLVALNVEVIEVEYGELAEK